MRDTYTVPLWAFDVTTRHPANVCYICGYCIKGGRNLFQLFPSVDCSIYWRPENIIIAISIGLLQRVYYLPV